VVAPIGGLKKLEADSERAARVREITQERRVEGAPRQGRVARPRMSVMQVGYLGDLAR
jgi:hypothetical protein